MSASRPAPTSGGCKGGRDARDRGVTYFLEWVQARFMEMEVSISQMMTELFKRCRREFNVQFERLVLRLHEVRCELPPLVKAWLYVDKLRLSESEELALLASVGNEYDVRKLRQAAIIQDRGFRRGGTELIPVHVVPRKRAFDPAFCGPRNMST